MWGRRRLGWRLEGMRSVVGWGLLDSRRARFLNINLLSSFLHSILLPSLSSCLLSFPSDCMLQQKVVAKALSICLDTDTSSVHAPAQIPSFFVNFQLAIISAHMHVKWPSACHAIQFVLRGRCACIRCILSQNQDFEVDKLAPKQRQK